MCAIWRQLCCVPSWNAFDGLFQFLLLKLLEKWKHYTFLPAISSSQVLAQAVLVCSIYLWLLLGVCILHVIRYKRLTVTLITIIKYRPFSGYHCSSMEDHPLSSSRDLWSERCCSFLLLGNILTLSAAVSCILFFLYLLTPPIDQLPSYSSFSWVLYIYIDR